MTSADTRPVHPWVTAGERVRHAIVCATFPDPRALRDELRRLEDLGYDAAFLPDHPVAVMGDPWLALATCAATTTRLRLGVMVSCVAYRHPAMLARLVADVDRLSDGRAVLGLGSGDMPHEFAMLGLDWGTPRSRRTLLAQHLQVLPALLRGEPVTFAGDGFALRDATLPLPAVQEPHVPVVLAGGSRGMLQLAAQHADAINLGSAAWAGGVYSDDDVRDRFTALDGFCADAGRDPKGVLRTAYLGISVAPTTEEATALLDGVPPEVRGFFAGLFHAGNPEQTAAYVQGAVDAGFRYLVFFPVDVFTGARRMSELLVTDVLPRLRDPLRV